MRIYLSVPVVGVALALVGCGGGDGLPREPVAGKVTVDGRPLANGMVTFAPEGGGEPVVSAVVRDGAYEVPRVDGPVPGKHVVTFWGKEPTGKKVKDKDDPEKLIDEYRDVVPRKYGLDSGLSAAVEAGKANTFDFDLSGVKAPSQASRPGDRRARR